MQTVQYIPGAVGGLATHTLPAGAPDIETVVSAEIQRLPSALAAHAGGAAPLIHAAGAAPLVHAGADVAAHANHSHALITQGVAGAVGVAIGWDAVPAIAQLEDAGAAALHTLAGGGATGIQDYVMPAHVPTQPNDHTAPQVVGAVANHATADVALALADHLGANPVVAAGAVVRLTTRTLTLANATLVGDLLTLNYLEVGEQVLVS